MLPNTNMYMPIHVYACRLHMYIVTLPPDACKHAHAVVLYLIIFNTNNNTFVCMVESNLK